MNRTAAFAVLCVLLLAPAAMAAASGDKGRVQTDFVFIQTNISDQYRNDRDVVFQVRCKAYQQGIPLDSSISLYVYDQNGQYLLDTESPNPMTVEPGQIASVNMGRCEVGLYRAKLLARSGSLEGTLTAQWVVMYPPHDYYFAWRGQTTSMHGLGTVKAEFRSRETYTVRVFNESSNGTETVERLRGFDVTIYTYDAGGRHVIRQYINVTGIDETFREIYQAGIYADVRDVHGWVNAGNTDYSGQRQPYHWLGARKWTAEPRWTTEQVVISAIVLVALIIVVGQHRIGGYREQRRRERIVRRRRELQPFAGEDNDE